jgi:hypothetical protein
VNIFGLDAVLFVQKFDHIFLAEQSHVEWFIRAHTLLDFARDSKYSSDF